MREHPNIMRMRKVRARRRYKAELPDLIEQYKGVIELIKEMKKHPKYKDRKENLNRALDIFSEGLKELKEELQ